LSKKLYEKVNYPGNKFKNNYKLLGWIFDQSLLLRNDEAGSVTHIRSRCHTRHTLVLITVLAEE